MMTLIKQTFYLLAILVAVSGCVTKGTYDTALSDINDLSTDLAKAKSQVISLRDDNFELRKELAALASAMDGELYDLSSRLLELRTEKDDLKILLAKANTEIFLLKTENDYLRREVDRLMVKAGEVSAEKELELTEMKKAYDELVEEMKGEIDKGEIKIVQAIDKLSVHFVEKILFDSGKAEIKSEGFLILGRVGKILQKSVKDRQIRVEGHTDNVPIGKKLVSTFTTNWELSTMRATTIVRYLTDNVGIEPTVLSAAGYSLYRPVATNDTSEGRYQNRRIEIVLLPLDVDRVLEELKK